MYPSFFVLKPMFESQCSLTWTRRFKHTILYFISLYGTNANCMQPQMVCLQYAAETRKWGGIPYLRLDLCWLFCCQLRYWLKRRSSSASVRVTQRFGDVSIKLDLHLPSNSHIFYTIITTDDQINLGTLIECFTDCLCNEKKNPS